MVNWLNEKSAPDSFPPPQLALQEPNGLLAAGGDLSVERLLAAYDRGIFPWYSDGEPILWWSPDPRAVFYPDEFHCPRRLARTIRNGDYRFSIDENFTAIIDGCAEPRSNNSETWITDAMRQAYLALHNAGHAHSCELWRGGELLGGLYGVARGGAFFGESMFSLESNASKVILVLLNQQLARWGFTLFDCQVESQHLASLGATALPRRRFIQQLKSAVQKPARDDWRVDSDISDPQQFSASYSY